MSIIQVQGESKDAWWSIKIKKKATSDALLKPLVKKLLALLGPGGSGTIDD